MDKIQIAYNPDFAPFSKREESNVTGLIIDRLEKILQSSSIPYDFVATTLPKLIPDLESGKVDAIAALGITPERQNEFQFSKSVMVSGGAWFVPKIKAMIADDEVPASIITPERGPLANEIRNKYPEAKVITCADYDAALKGAIERKAIAAALNWHVGRMMINEHYQGQFHIPKCPYNTVALGLAVLDENKNIVTRLNKNIPDDWGYDPI